MDSKNGKTTAEEQTQKEQEGLTYIQRRALVCFMTGMTSAEAAVECNVSKKTMDRIRGNKVLKETLAQAGTQIYLTALAELTLSAKKAVKRINSILEDETTPQRTQLVAADLVLKHIDKITNFYAFERMVELERLLTEDTYALPCKGQETEGDDLVW